MRLGGLLGFGRGERLIHTVDEAIAAVAEALPGFAAFDAAIGDDGRAALTIDPTGRLALVVARGARVRAREVQWPMLRLIDGGVLIETRDRRLGAVVLNRLTAVDMRRLGMPPLPQRETAELVYEPEAA
ncbi:hypothetical protein [Sphingomonas phyllosphaerae]|uniref:hypothetical protein n=1 Tax=Sphingomonas phyllosphaerae TaxID=257003 RepID=UPI000419DDC2|nr:hypothetical protein [Sphingomonas phyllosphaerae]